MKKFLLIFFLCLTSTWAAQDIYQFTSTEQQQRFSALTSELRCLVCQNQNLAESNAALAADLRTQIYAHLQQGESDQQIVDYLVTRYGDFILYRPPLKSATLGLWFGPFIILIVGLGYLFYYVRQRQK